MISQIFSSKVHKIGRKTVVYYFAKSFILVFTLKKEEKKGNAIFKRFWTRYSSKRTALHSTYPLSHKFIWPPKMYLKHLYSRVPNYSNLLLLWFPRFFSSKVHRIEEKTVVYYFAKSLFSYLLLKEEEKKSNAIL